MVTGLVFLYGKVRSTVYQLKLTTTYACDAKSWALSKVIERSSAITQNRTVTVFEDAQWNLCLGQSRQLCKVGQ
jgi:hypothetical protein